MKKKESENAIIQILNYNENSDKYLLYNTSLNRIDLNENKLKKEKSQKTLLESQIYFLVPISIISEAAQPIFARNIQFTLGTLTLETSQCR